MKGEVIVFYVDTISAERDKTKSENKGLRLPV